MVRENKQLFEEINLTILDYKVVRSYKELLGFYWITKIRDTSRRKKIQEIIPEIHLII